MTTLMTLDTARSASVASDAEDVAILQVADFETIFLRFQGPITRFIARRVGNYELAFDLAQDVFIKAYKALLSGTVIPQRALSSWLYRIASNTIIDTQRRQHLLPLLSLSLFNEEGAGGVGVFSPSTEVATVCIYRGDEEDERPERITVPCSRQRQCGIHTARFEERVADRQIIERVFGRMSPKYRVCLWLHEHEGFSCPEIGKRLHISVTAVKMRLKRAREQFLTLYRQEIAR
ncbi:MAG TPA: RNA polymerase sigma factor [Ktedonobacteraceae bacterium]|nr:RNA polymerase sigma factor [Ktedonobacteraceae bacterium]